MTEKVFEEATELRKKNSIIHCEGLIPSVGGP